MSRWRRIQFGLALSVAASLALMIDGSLGKIVSFLLALWTALAIWLLLRCESRLRLDLHHELLIRTMNHHRHDWMNDLQVLFGYISLRKFDIVPVYVDKIRAKIANESGISKLGVPFLVAYLMSFRTGKRNLALEIELEQEISLPSLLINADMAASVICETVGLFDRMAAEPEEASEETNVLSLQLEREDDGLLMDFVYTGSYADGLEANLRSLLGKRKATREAELDLGEGRAVCTIRMPLSAPAADRLSAGVTRKLE